MGSAVSSLEIHIPEPGQNEILPVAAGSTISGKVVTELTKPLAKNEHANSTHPVMTLQFYGKEKVCMNRGKSTVQQGSTGGWWTASKHAERFIVNLILNWPEFPSREGEPTSNTVPPGTYVFPFTIQLPNTLPSSTYYPMNDNRNRSNLSFRIQYKLEANLMNVTTNKSILATSKYLWVKAAAPVPRPEPIPCMVEPVAHEITGCGLFKRGTILFGAALDDCCISDNVLNLHVSCRNDSSVDIQQVKVFVLENLTWRTPTIEKIDPKTGACTTSSSLTQSETNLLFALNDIQLPGLAVERKGLLQTAFDSITGMSQVEKLQRQIHNDLTAHRKKDDSSSSSENNLIRIQLPQAVRESYAGQLLQVSHVVRILFQTDGILSNNPVVEIPIHILGMARPDDEAVAPGLPQQRRSGAGQAYELNPPPPKPKIMYPAETGVGHETPSKEEQSVVTYQAEIVPCSSNDSTGVPMVEVQPLPEVPDSALEATPVTADVIVLGGDAMSRGHSRRRLADLVPMAPPTAIATLETLLAEMRSSINEYDLISGKLLEKDQKWQTLLGGLSPDDFGRVIAHVSVETDQPRVASLLASHLLQQQQHGLTCQHAAAAVRNTSDLHRAFMAQRLLPLCTDADQHQDLVLAELNDWQRAVVLNAFVS